VRFVFVEHGNGVRAMQLNDGCFDGLKQIAVVEAIHQVGNDLGVGLAQKLVALGLQRGAQLVVVFDDAVVHQRHTAHLIRHIACVHTRASTCTVAEVWMGVVHRRRTVRGPTCVCNACAAFDVVGLDLIHQLRHARRAARTL
jgi:hypothetical protein